VETYLEKSVESVLKQTFSDYELILVDDCSPDGCPSLCDTMAGRDRRVRVIHKPKNEGLGPARNDGLRIARGRYISFVDSDDWVEPDMLETLYGFTEDEKYDLTVCGYRQDFIDATGSIKYSVAVSGSPAKAEDHADSVAEAVVLDSKKLLCFAWNKLYRLSVIRDGNLAFSKQKLIEDVIFNLDYIQSASNLVFTDRPLYHYIRPEKETLSTAHAEDVWDIFRKRFHLFRALLLKNQLYDGALRSSVCNVHIKHVVSVAEKSCASPADKYFAGRCKTCSAMLRDLDTREAIRFGKADTRAQRLMNAVVKTRSAPILLLFAMCLSFAKRKTPFLFDSLK